MVSRELVIAVGEGKCEQHKADHSFRVMRLAWRIFELELANAPQEIRDNQELYLQVLAGTAVLHDREMSATEPYDFGHGLKAAGIVDEVIGEMVSPEGRELIKLLCINHVPVDGEFNGLTEAQAWLLKVFKDADGLDRVRFDNGNPGDKKDILDERYLRLPSSGGLTKEARALWERTKHGFASPVAAFDAVFSNEVE